MTVQPFGSVPVQSPDHVTPDHGSGSAVSVTPAPGANVAEHVPGHAMPAGLEVTAPTPSPFTRTRNRWLNVAVTVCAPSAVSEHVGVVPAQAPPQDTNA